MAVNTTEIVTVYNILYDTTLAKYDAQYAANTIDPETYSKLVGTVSADTMKLAIDAVQNQEKIALSKVPSVLQ